MDNENLKNLPKFYVGETIVCVNDEPGWLSNEKTLVRNKRYKVFKVLNNTVWIGPNCRGWDYSRFRSIQEAKFPLIPLSKVIEREKQLVSAN